MLDPKTLTPESFYRLQSKTWAQGAETERERILAELTRLTDRFNRGESDSNMVMYLYRFIEEQKNGRREDK